MSLIIAEKESLCKSLPIAAQKWERQSKTNNSSEKNDGSFSLLSGTGVDIYLMDFFKPSDLALLSCANKNLNHMCKLFCSERLSFFLFQEKQENSDIENHTVVKHFLQNGYGGIFRMLHVITHSQEQTERCTLAMGVAHSAVVERSSKRVYTFGEGSQGQLGLGLNDNNVTPSLVNLDGLILPKNDQNKPLGKPVGVGCGAFHTAILLTCGRIVTFGLNSKGQLGDESLDSRNSPALIAPRFDENNEVVRYSQVVTGRCYTAAITVKGRVAVFGKGLFCKRTKGFLLEDGDIKYNQGEVVLKLAAGEEHLIMKTNKNRVFAIGKGDKGKLGLARNLTESDEEKLIEDKALKLACEKNRLDASTDVPRLVATPDFEDGEFVVQVAAGGNHSALVTNHGNLLTWGGSSYGELGHGKFTRAVPKPTKVENFKNCSPFVIYVSCGRSHTAALTSTGDIVTFGDGVYSQNGKKPKSGFFANNKPQKIVLGEIPLNDNLSSVVCGGRMTGSLNATGQLYCFGDPMCTGKSFRSFSSAQNRNHLPKNVSLVQNKDIMQRWYTL